jgi:hypothetical protein
MSVAEHVTVSFESHHSNQELIDQLVNIPLLVKSMFSQTEDDYLGVCLSGLDDNGVSVRVYLDDAPRALIIDFDAAWQRDPEREVHKSAFLESLLAAVFPAVGRMVSINGSEIPSGADFSPAFRYLAPDGDYTDGKTLYRCLRHDNLPLFRQPIIDFETLHKDGTWNKLPPNSDLFNDLVSGWITEEDEISPEAARMLAQRWMENGWPGPC